MTVATYKLKAINPDLNVNRYYEIDILQDLFGDWIIVTYYGRIRFKGQKKQYGYSSYKEMTQKLFAILRKRFQAQKRIGCNYSLESFCANKCYGELETLIEHARTKQRTEKRISKPYPDLE